MFEPSRCAHRKSFRGSFLNISKRNNSVNRGIYGIMSLSRCALRGSHMESARKSAARILKSYNGKLYFGVFPSIPVTRKPSDVRMGSGKGSIDHYSCYISPGCVVCEVFCCNSDVAYSALSRALDKLPFTGKIIYRKFFGMR